MKKLTSVLYHTLFIFGVLIFFELVPLAFVALVDNTEIPWEFFCFLNIYGMIMCIIFSLIDRPIDKKRFLIGITICAVVGFIISFFVENEVLRMQSYIVIFGIMIGKMISKIIEKEIRRFSIFF